MAGETTKSTRLTSVQAGKKKDARLQRGREFTALDTEAIAATELEAADVTIFDIPVPSNAIITEIAVYNDDLDSNGSPTLTLDVGLAAGEDFTSVTSSTATKHSEDDVLDADAFVDGSTTLQAATTSYTVQAFDATTFGPDDANKPAWEVLGYDEDPRTTFRIAATFAAGAATAIRVKYVLD
jgi:hypothetical protein